MSASYIIIRIIPGGIVNSDVGFEPRVFPLHGRSKVTLAFVRNNGHRLTSFDHLIGAQ